MKLSAELSAFCQRIGHVFAKPDLLVRSLTHASMTSANRENNERLEFLGDRVLGLVMAEALYSGEKAAREGQMAPQFNALVRKETCAEVARSVDLGLVLKLGRSEMKSGGRRKEALLADAMEAVIAAVYQDAGFEAARAMVLRLWGKRVTTVAEDARDPKTALQEWAQGRGMPAPSYKVDGREGPDHAPVFTMVAQLADGRSSRASAASKRRAEQLAAEALLKAVETERG